MQSGQSYAAKDLSIMFGTSRRTIFRDLKELQEIGVPYHFDSDTGGYVIEPEFFLPPVDLDLKEALSLLMLVHKVRDKIQLPFSKSAMLAPIEHSGGLDAVFTKLQNALTRKRKVAIRYNSLADKKMIEIELAPYHLFYNQRAWYVLGHSSLHNSIRTFKLNRIQRIEITDKCFIDGEDFDPHEHFGRAWSMIPEGKIYNVKLRFLPKVACNVTEVKWHSTQQVTHNDDGSATIEFRVDGLGEISWWILGYGDQVKILAPRALRKKVIGIAKNMIEINEKA